MPSSSTSTSLISPQFHSRNDLREWPALFRKGARSLKIDPHFVGRLSDKFVLSHNTPLPWQYHRNEYSTLDDLLILLQRPPAFLYGERIDIALCFKAAPKHLCDHEEAANNKKQEVQDWLRMADDFFAKADQLVRRLKEQMDITLTFVLDGDGKPCDCLADKFLPWKSVWIDKDKCSKECFDSNDGFCERFAILNNPTTSDWMGMAANSSHYGKFGLDSSQALQVWEPDEQEEISKLVQGYMKGLRTNVPSGGGLAFSINVDAAMFDIFSARPLSGTVHARGFNLVVQDDDAAAPRLVYEAPGQMVLQYQAALGRVQRTITFQPFTQINVGEPEVNDVPIELGTNTSESGSLVMSSQDEDTIRAEFGSKASQLSSWSALHVDNFSFLFVAVGGKVYASASRRINQEHHHHQDIPEFRLIGLGNHVHASSLNATVLLVTEGNHCYNSHHNNIRAGPLVCRPQTHTKRHGCPSALDYSLGTAENLFLWLQGKRTVITSCNSHILHGTFTGGLKPTGALFPMEEEGKVGIMVAHEPFPEHARSPCGVPMTNDKGIVISSFASHVVLERFSETIQHTERVALEASSFDHFMGLKVLLALGLLVCWVVLRWRRRKSAPSTYQPVISATELVPTIGRQETETPSNCNQL